MAAGFGVERSFGLCHILGFAGASYGSVGGVKRSWTAQDTRRESRSSSSQPLSRPWVVRSDSSAAAACGTGCARLVSKSC